MQVNNATTILSWQIIFEFGSIFKILESTLENHQSAYIWFQNISTKSVFTHFKYISKLTLSLLDVNEEPGVVYSLIYNTMPPYHHLICYLSEI